MNNINADVAIVNDKVKINDLCISPLPAFNNQKLSSSTNKLTVLDDSQFSQDVLEKRVFKIKDINRPVK